MINYFWLDRFLSYLLHVHEMRTSPAPYTKDITALLEKQERIYEEWLNGQHNIFERYMKGFEYMFGGMKKKKNGSIKRSIKRSR